MTAINTIPLNFDVQKILSSIGVGVLLGVEFKTMNQLSITHSEYDSGLFSSVGSLYDYETREYKSQTSDYTKLNKLFANTYLEKVIASVATVAKEDNVNLGRVRALMLKPVSCYSYHRDKDEHRYHIPLVTTKESFFVIDGKMEFMPDLGQLYRLETKKFHTAINCSTETARIHLVFDTFKTQ